MHLHSFHQPSAVTGSRRGWQMGTLGLRGGVDRPSKTQAEQSRYVSHNHADIFGPPLLVSYISQQPHLLQ